MDERLEFVARLLDGEKMAGLCRIADWNAGMDKIFPKLEVRDLGAVPRGRHPLE